MSGEQLANHNKTKKVNINILLKKVRADKKKAQLESNLFFGLVFAVILTAGIFVSL